MSVIMLVNFVIITPIEPCGAIAVDPSVAYDLWGLLLSLPDGGLNRVVIEQTNVFLFAGLSSPILAHLR